MARALPGGERRSPSNRDGIQTSRAACPMALEKGLICMSPGPLPFRLAGSADPLPMREFLVDDLLGAGDRFSLFGPPAAGKSNLAIQLAVCVALGRPFFGRKIVRSGAVLILAAEGRSSTERRLELIAA